MLRFAFWTLLVLNGAVYAYSHGYFGTASGGEHEPERLKRQFNTAKMTMLTNAQADAMARQASASAASASGASTTETAGAAAVVPVPATAPAAAAAGANPAAADPAAAAIACTEIGTFDASEARRFDTRLAALELGDKQSRQAQQEQDVSSFLVNIPPQGSKEAADRKADELRNLGVTDFYVLQGDSPLKYALSLGVFKTESGAQARLAQLNKQGVRTARITPRGPQTTVYTYRFRDVTEPVRARIVALAGAIGTFETHSCR
ncbi:SPOR domain-containing protein [Massilia sp. 9096]|uniref:SPOR domain-containing protein n=1 Tax=Massilia sp. 9096 TaxID=1500894 RepID=UPI00055BCBD5|nr:SPOR domain-containing protein [Massilia sp. 9096]